MDSEINVKLMKKHFCAGVTLDPSVVEFGCNTDFDTMTRTKLVRAFINLYVQDVEEIKYKWPKDWRESLKERFAPDWFKSRWPVVYTTKGHKVYLQYKDIAINDKPHVVLVERYL